MLKLSHQLVLGSNSPRRKQLLEALGFEFVVRTQDSEEVYPESLPKTAVATYLAEMKAKVLLPTLADNELCITSDTTVVMNNRLLEKAGNEQEARAMLKALSGQTHEVITGVCLQTKRNREVFQDATKVRFRLLEEAEISYYIHKFAPFDKAGAYGIQEWIGMVGIASLQGSYFNVMGLPTEKLFRALKKYAVKQ